MYHNQSSSMHIHSPFTGGFKSAFLKKDQMKRYAMHICTIIMHKAIPTGIPVSGQGFFLALTQAGGYLAT